MSKCKRWVVEAMVLHRIGDSFAAVTVANEATGKQRVAASIEGRTFNREDRARGDLPCVRHAMEVYASTQGVDVVYADDDE